VDETKAKYGVHDEDVHNFDETGFQMGVIGSMKVVTGSERRSRPDLVQPGDREWVTVIQSICSDGSYTDDPMLLLFHKLEHVARLLGSDITAVYHIEPLMNNSTSNNREMFKQSDMGSARGVGREAARDTKPSSPSTENTQRVSSRAAMVASDHRRGKVAGFSRQGLHKAFEEIGRNI
jgi:hypothetical protein